MRVALQDAARKILTLEKDPKSEAFVFAKTLELGGDLRSLITANDEERKAFEATLAPKYARQILAKAAVVGTKPA